MSRVDEGLDVGQMRQHPSVDSCRHTISFSTRFLYCGSGSTQQEYCMVGAVVE